MPHKKKDKALISELKNPKDRNKAFEELIDIYQEKIYWHIRKIVIRHEDANDVLQNTFIRVFKSIVNFRGESSLQTWMFKIAYNESLRFISKNKIQMNSLDENGQKYIETLTEDEYFNGDELQTKLHEVINELSEKQRLVFQMKYFDDLSFREISEILDINENTLKSSYYGVVKIIEEKVTSES